LGTRLAKARKRMRVLGFAALGLLLAACAPAGPDSGSIVLDEDGKGDGRGVDLLTALRGLPGVVQVVEENSAVNPPPGQTRDRTFQILFQQPLDHDDPSSGTFTQRIWLAHHTQAAPLVLSTLGYDLDEGYEELTGILKANQLSVEHRYFSASRPSPTDWSLLTIEQAAADHHAIVEAFRPIYGGAWISTGASKGGMTALIHRSRYPDDVAGTVAYVAPYPHTIEDPRFTGFFDQVGDATCRDRLLALERGLLLRKQEMIRRMLELPGDSFERLGPDAAFTNAVVDLRWYFWQYEPADNCAGLPDSGAPDDDLWAAFRARDLPGFNAEDHEIARFEAYVYQAARQLGYPAEPTQGLEDLLPPGPLPKGLPVGEHPSFDPAGMQKVQDWLLQQGERVMLVYGQDDPWTAGAFELGQGPDLARFDVPGANHGAAISDLPDGPRAQALAMLQRFVGTTSTLQSLQLDARWHADELARRSGNRGVSARLLAR
jgi:hypothetical protein